MSATPDAVIPTRLPVVGLSYAALDELAAVATANGGTISEIGDDFTARGKDWMVTVTDDDDRDGVLTISLRGHHIETIGDALLEAFTPLIRAATAA